MLHIFRRHQKVIFAVLAVVVIITFVFWGAMTGEEGRRQARMVSPGKMYGKAVAPEDWMNAQRAIALFHYFRTGQIVDFRRSGQEMERAAWLSLLQRHKARALGLHVPQERAVEFIQQLAMFQKEERFEPGLYRRFVKETLPWFGLDEEDFLEVIREQLAVDQLREVVASTAKVTSLDVRQDYQETNDKLTIAIATFNSSNYVAQVKLTDKDIQEDFEKNKENYRIPDRVKVRYLKLSADAFLPKVEVTGQEIKDRYEKHKAAFTDPKTKAVKPLEAVRADLRREIALPKAMKLATDLADRVREEVLPDPRYPDQKRPDIQTVAKQHGLALADTDFFSAKDELKFASGGFQKAALSLSPDDPCKTAKGPDCVYVISFVERKPSELPKLEAARTQVAEDLARRRAFDLACKDGQEKRDKFRAALQPLVSGSGAPAKPNTTLELLATAAGVKVLTPPAFAASDPPRDLPYARLVVEACQSLAPGELSDFIETAEGGLLVQLKQRAPADTKKLAEQEKTMRERLLRGDQFRMLGFGEPGRRELAINAWINVLAREANIETARAPEQDRQAPPAPEP
ncbi:MAG: hypothetical protein FJ388_11110 [Verrucomicrobia bacterium]|nr:hypothetical protein [Verrucomicrobiota bacterium]